MSSQAHEWQTIGHSLTEVRPASRCPSPNSNLFGSLSRPRKLFELVTVQVAFLRRLFCTCFLRYLGWTRPLEAVDLVREVLTEQNIEGQCLTEIEMSFFI